jgi:hypothetical protein
MRKRFVAGLALAAWAVGGVASAGDPPAKAADVEVKFAAKAGDTFRFRQTEDSSTEVGGKPTKGTVATQEYTVKVKETRKDGGLDVEVTFDSIKVKMLSPMKGAWTEVDAAKPLTDGPDVEAQAMGAMMHAMLARPFTVSLDAGGAPAAVKGLREAMKEGMKGSKFEAMMPVDQIFGDADCIKLAKDLFAPLPAGAHAVGSTWSGQSKHDVSSQPLDFATDWTLSAATADDASVAAKYTWKPGDKATADGAKTAGGGTATTVFNRKDGFVNSMKRHLEANRETKEMKATSHTDLTIERLPAK